MPVANKRFFTETSMGREWEGFWDSLWSQACDALMASSEIYLIGYSLPEYDNRARNLLATGIGQHSKVTVCCRDATSGVVESLKRLLPESGLNVTPASTLTFEGWVSEVTQG